MALCEECHDTFHSNNNEYKRVKTSEGYELIKIQ